MIAHVPSTLNADPNRLTGNELTALNLSLPIHVSDPLDRLRLTALATSLAKEDSELLGPMVEQSWAGYLPRSPSRCSIGWPGEAHGTPW